MQDGKIQASALFLMLHVFEFCLWGKAQKEQALVLLLCSDVFALVYVFLHWLRTNAVKN